MHVNYLLSRITFCFVFMCNAFAASSQCTYHQASAGSNSAVTFTLAGGSFQSYGCAGADPTYWVAGSAGPMTITFATAQNNPSIRVWGMNSDDVASVSVNGSAYTLNSGTASYNPKVVCGISPGPNGVTFSGGNLTGANSQVDGNWSYQDVIINASNVTTITINSLSGLGWGFVGASTTGLSVSATAYNTTCGNNNGSAAVSVSGSGTYNYIWSNGATTDSVSNLAAGTYTVTVSDAGTCSAVTSATVNASSSNAITITGDKSIMCSGDSAGICAPTGFATYLWNTGATNSCIYVKGAGNYYVTATDGASCTVTSNTVTIAVYPSPPVSIAVNGDTLTGYNAVAYQWYLDNGPIQDATDSVYIAQQSGSYILEVTDTNGCRSTSVPVVVTISSITDLMEDTEFTVYPNPLQTGNWKLIAGDNLMLKPFEIFDANGRLVYKAEINSHKQEISLSLEKGIYFFRVNTATQSITRKLIKLN
jgi:hypothetical protein